jgi:hypothetical protein
MPNPGQVNNPAGVNSFDHFAPEPAYGEGLQTGANKQAAPLAGGAAAASVIDAPRRAKRSAGKQPQPAPVQPGVAPGAPSQVTGTAAVAAFWQQVARVPGASPLVQQLAAQAANGAAQ